MKNSRFKKSLSVFLSLLMMLTTLAVGFAPMTVKAAVGNNTLLGRYFSTDNVWYNAARRANGVEWQTGDYLSYDASAGMTRFNGSNYVKFEDNIFDGVSASTGLTFAYTYRPNFGTEHRHLLSIGQNAYGNGQENHFFISGAKSWYSDGKMPVVAWMNGGTETIRAYPAGVAHTSGETYNVVITVDKTSGVTFYINGEKKNTVYVDSDLNGQKGNIEGFLNQVGSYHYNYFGCSRWTGDAKLDGWVGDFRIYKGVATDDEAYMLYAGDTGVSPALSDMVARYFTANDVWYNAVTGKDGAAIYYGDTPSYSSGIGMTYLNGGIVKLESDLFKDVTRSSGVSFAFNYRPGFGAGEQFRHILSIGRNAYGNGTANHLFISGAHTQHSNNLLQVTWVNGSGTELINAYANGVPQEFGREYNVVVVIDQNEGVVFYVDGVKKTTVYANSDFNGQIGNVQSFLDEVNTYRYNYVGCSRWTNDNKIVGYLSDLRVYKSAKTEADAYTVVTDMAGTAFNLAQPSFNATAYHYSDPANGAYANLAYSSPATNEDSGMGIRGADNSDDYKDIEAVYFKFFTPLNVVMVYDGAHETYASIELETKRHNKTNVQDQRIYYVISNSSLLKTRHNWYGYLDSAWKTWAGAYTANQINTNPDLDVYVGSTNDTPRFWWNAIKYTGTGNNETYYDHEQNISFTLQAFFDYTVGSTSKGTGTITTLSNYYVLNYKPVYDVLNAAAAKYNNEMAGNAWMYTEASYAKAMLAMRRLALCNPNLYDYNGRGVDAAAVMCAAAIKQAKENYDAINLVKKTATVHISEGTGTTITVTNNGTPVADGAVVNYGDTLTVSAAAQDAYDQHTPVVTISDEESAASTLVNRPEITISTAALALNTYTLTFDPNGGTLSGDATVTATYTQPLPAATQATRDGYTFQRYAYNSGNADYAYYNENYENIHGNYDVKGDVTVTAQWTPTPYSITFVPNGCTIDASAQANFGGTYTIEDVKTLPTATAPVGYHFDGWTVTASGDHGWGSEKIAANAAVTGKWGNVTLTATYAPNTDTAYTVEYYEMGTDGAYPAAPTRTESLTGTTGETAAADTTAPVGFTFDEGNVNKITSAPIAADGSTVLKVYFSRNQYTVNVTLGEGATLNVANGAKYYYGETVVFNVTADTGYDISTLSMTVDGAPAENGAAVTVSGDINVVVSDLSKLKYTVTVTEGVGTSITGASAGKYEYGSSITVTAAANEGYNNAGLKLMANGAVVTNPYTFTVTGDITISTADLNKLTFTVTKTEGAGTAITGDGTYAYGDSVTVSAAALEGYTGDLVLKVNGEEVSNPYTFIITDNVAVSTDPRTAITYYTVVFNNYDNTKLYETSVPAGGTAEYQGAEPAKPAEGAHTFTFAGWDKPLTNINETTVLTAQFNTVHSYNDKGFDADGHYMKCTECGLIDENTREDHTLSTVTDRVATCSVEGMAHEECAYCDYATVSASTGLNENNHTAVSDVPAVPETCCTVGYTAGKQCPACGVYTEGHEQIEADPVNGHLYPDAWTPANGTHTKTCTREGCTDAIDNHTVTEACSGGTATCIAKATCSVCGGEYGEVDPANHEDLKPVTGNPATCTEPGNNAYYYCSACEKSFTDAEGAVAATQDDIVIPASGHDWSVAFTWDDTATPPTATAAFVCANSAEHNVTVDATVTEIASTAAHCGEEGSVTYRASYTMDGVTYATDDTTDKTVTTDSLPHLWRVQSWAWSADHSTVTLNLICDRDGTHTHQIANITAAEETVSDATCTADKVVKYTASAEYEGYSFTTETEEITLADSRLGHDFGDWTQSVAPTCTAAGEEKRVCTRENCSAFETRPVEAIGHTYAFAGWTWADDHSTAAAKFVCTVENCVDTVFVSDDETEENLIAAPDCENDKVVTYTASVEFKLTKNGDTQTFTDTTDEITLENTKTAHTWGDAAYTWNENGTVTAKRVCANYAAHVEEETVTPSYAVTTDPTYTEKGEGTYTAAFTNAAFETKTRTEEIASIREQLEAALNGSGSGIDDIDALLEAAQKIVNGEAPYTAPYEEGYVDTLSDLLEEFEGSKNDPTKADTLADTLEEIKALVDSHEDHIVYTVTYVLNGGSAENKASFVRTDAAFTLNNPTKNGYVFAGWTGTGLSEATLTVTVNPADAENKEFTATWTLDHTDAEAAINNAAALIEDAADDYEDAYSNALAELVSQLEAAVAADEPDADAIRSLVDQVNAKTADAANNKHVFTVAAGYKEGAAPTCTEAGVALVKCANCEKTTEKPAAALGHSWGEWIVDVPADYGVDGHAHRTCARCGATENKTLTLSAEYDRQIRFNVIPKMHYVIEVGDGYAVYNTNTILWYSAAELHFHVYTYTNSGYGDNYTVYINGKAATPDANGSYTLTAGSVSDTVSISVNNGTVTPSQPGTGHDAGSSGECAYCGKVHPNTLWGRIVALFHAIFAFFRDLFKR